MGGDPYTAPDFGFAALVTIDCQRDVLDGRPLEVPGSSAVLPAIATLVGGFRDAGMPVVHVVRLYRPDGSNVDLCRRRMVEDGAAILSPGSEGSQLAAELTPGRDASLLTDMLLAGELQQLGPGEVVLYKSRWGAFFDTPLDTHLRAMDVSTLVFCGFNFPNCPRASMYEASERDYRVVMATDAISGLYSLGERELAGIGVSLMGSGEIVESLRARAASVR
jgi:nicotinamidase-related amidase